MPQNRPPHLASRDGFTLIELVTLLVVLAVVVSLATPSMQGVTSRTRTRGAIDQLTADVALARMYAVRDGRQTAVVVRSASRYVIVRDPAGTPDTVKRVDLSRDYVGVQLTPATGQLAFNSRGLLQAGSLSSVRATHRGVSDSVTISSVGRTYRDY